jgi:hypothetical protein
MLIKICQTCKKPFRALPSPYIKFCSAECVDEAYQNRQLDQETINCALEFALEFTREREVRTKALRELFFLEILKMNRLLSPREYENHRKEILENESGSK